MPAPTSITLASPGKINHRLKIIRRLESGYHEIETVMQPIDLCDEVRLEWVKGSPGEVGVVCDQPGIPTDGSNLAARGAQAALARFEGPPPGKLLITLRKRIPAGAGLGGGSSNAAAAIKGVNELLNIGLKTKEMEALAAQIGMDVPFFIGQRPSLATGRGERIEPLARFPETFLALLIPAFEVNTGWAYGAWRSCLTEGKKEAKLPAFLGESESLIPWMENDLQEVVAARHMEIEAMVRSLKKAGAMAAQMSGSGSAVFGLFRDDASARGAVEALDRKAGCRALAARGQGAG